MKDWNEWMDKYNPHVDKSDYYAPYGYNIGHAVVDLLKQCGDDLTRENVMEKASHLNMDLPLLLPGIRLTPSPTITGRSSRCGWCASTASATCCSPTCWPANKPVTRQLRPAQARLRRVSANRLRILSFRGRNPSPN